MPDSTYADYLEAAGHTVLRQHGVAWYAYNGFMMPAYLPHSVPAITNAQAAELRRSSGRPFARWISDFHPGGSGEATNWWYINRQGPYAMEQLSGNTRSKLRRGLKRLQARLLHVDEVLTHGYAVCRAAVERYGEAGFLPSQEMFRRRVEAARAFPATVEYYGVLDGDRLLGFSENYLQDGAVFWESIWYDPAGLSDYSSYALTHAMLEDYLNQRGLAYVTDGSRSLYHDTQVQAFFIEKFGFHRAHAHLHVSYAPWFSPLMTAADWLAGPISRMAERWRHPVLAKMSGLLRQHRIARGADDSRG